MMVSFEVESVFFCSDDFGEFVADMVIVVDKENYEAKDVSDTTVEEALEDTANGGRIGNLQIDPQSLKMKAPGMLSMCF